MIHQETFFKDKALPFIECRYSKNSGKHYKPHIHSAFSIGAIDNGEVLYRVKDEEAYLKPNSLALINPDSLHHCNPLEELSRSYYMLYLDTSWCKKIQNSDVFINSNKILLEDKEMYDAYIQTMDFFMKEGFLLEKEQMMVSFLEKIFTKTTDIKTFTCKDFSLHVKTLKEQLSKNLDEDITLNKIADDLELNSYTLLRSFKQELGITPHAYRMNCRIELAKKLLQKKVDISEVALECGFFDQSHMHRHFKAITTVTPKEYQLNFIQ
ncbi:AraC family transcriptional regulator [Sulfurospirillum arcachonense]|uniref:AraC family transcriptional regulator n=1 Tax=Sulfurospirillum arcachonense TaxID=57666 RepID=UPI00046AEA5A|nr:AraC family transcriptional regulator [Sulfurospirillum arcachonense]